MSVPVDQMASKITAAGGSLAAPHPAGKAKGNAPAMPMTGLLGNSTIKTAPPAGARSGVAGKLRQFIELLRRTFSPAPAQAARVTKVEGMPPPQQMPSSIETRQRIDSLFDTLVATDSNPEKIAAALQHAAPPLGSPLWADASEEIKQRLQHMRTSTLQQLAGSVLVGDAVSQVQKGLDDCRAAGRPEAAMQLLLDRIKDEVKPALKQRASDMIDEAITAALQCAKSPQAARRTRAADHMQAALRSAVPLRSVDKKLDAEADVQRQVLKGLGDIAKRSPADIKILLQAVDSRDLGRLKVAAERSADQPQLKSAIEAEITGRSERLARQCLAQATGFAEASSLLDRYSVPPPSSLQTFPAELSELAATYKSLKDHCDNHGLAVPDSVELDGVSAPLGKLTQQAVELVASGVKSGAIDCKQLGADQVLRLAEDVRSLKGPEELLETLRPRSRELLDSQRELCRQHLAGVMDGLTGKSDPNALLGELEKLQQTAAVLERAATTFPSSDGGPDKLIGEWFDSLPEGERRTLGEALQKPDNQALISVLRDGEAAESHTRDPSMAGTTGHFGNMANLLEQMAAKAAPAMSTATAQAQATAPAAAGAAKAEATAPAAKPAAAGAAGAGGGAQAPPKPASPAPAQPAYTRLSDGVRKALRKNCALSVTGQGQATVKSGRFTAAQTEAAARIIERPASERESKLEHVGDYEVKARTTAAPGAALQKRPASVGPGFINDVRRRQRQQVILPSGAGQSTAKPLIEYDQWPQDEAGKNIRIAQGYAQLVELCGGDEQMASQLTVYGHQGVIAGVMDGLMMGENSPIQLTDGTPGVFAPRGEDPALTPEFEITYSMGANGRPQIDCSYRMAGRMAFADLSGRTSYLSSESYVQTSFRAELSPDGSLVLLGPPSYDFDLELDRFQKSYPRPTVQQLSEEADNSEMLKDVLKYAHLTGMEDPVLLLRALDAYEREPSLELANNLMDALDKEGRRHGLRSDPYPQVPRDTREAIRQQSKLATDNPFSPAILPKEALTEVRKTLSKEIEEKLLPGMIFAVENGRL